MDYNADNGQIWEKEPARQPGQMQAPYQSQVILREVGQRSENRLAVTSVVLGIITLVFFWLPVLSLVTGIAGIIFAIIALIKEERKGMPILGMVLCIIGLLLASLVTVGYLIQFLTYMGSSYY